MTPDAPVLLETIRIREGVTPLLELHRQRLHSSCRILGVPFPSALPLPVGGPDRVVRLEISADGVAVTERALGMVRPVGLITSQVVHEPYRHKILERTLFDRALEEARQAGADDGLLLTRQGHVTEAAVWCLFWWVEGTLCAPALALGVLPGVSRARIVQLAGPVAERRANRAELEGRSLFVSNAARGIVPVAVLDGQPVPEHPATARLQEAFWP
jgi:branched-subunit amino acid aminotransferase/4-amino-4-deoxychorismate lyase